MNTKDMAVLILENVGGNANVRDISHCATRLRFNLVNDKKVNKEKLEQIEGVLGVVNMGGQYQIIVGNDVGKVYNEVKKLGNFKEYKQKEPENKGVLSKILDVVTGIFMPILPAITAAGMMKAVMTLLTVTKLISNTSDTYKILNFIADAAFYFLPILIASSASEKFHTNRYLSMTLAGVLLHPNLGALLAASETGSIAFFGLPITFSGYSGSVIPIILTVWFMSYVEKLAEKITPKAIKFFTKPLIIILIVAPVALLFIGPLGRTLAGGIDVIFNAISSIAPWLLPMVVGAFMPLLVMTGMHYPIIALTTANITTYGFDGLISPGTIVANTAQGAAALAVALKTKNSSLKQLATSGGITALFGGITEPALYGVNLKYKTPFVAAMIGGGIGGLINGLLGVKRYAAGIAGLLTIPTYIGPDNLNNFWMTCVGVGAGIAVTFVISYVLFKDTPVEESLESVETDSYSPRSSSIISSPVSGKLIPISEIDDPTFASGIIGQGVAILPNEGKIVSPVNGVVSALFESKHAIGITSNEGYEILIHVGLDTVKLKGKCFTCNVKKNQNVKKGDLLLEFDLEGIKADGYDITTPVVVTNLDENTVIKLSPDSEIKAQEFLIELVK